MKKKITQTQNKGKVRASLLIYKGEFKVRSIKQEKRRALLLKRYNPINEVIITLILYALKSSEIHKKI